MNGSFFLTVLEFGKSKIQVPEDLVSDKDVLTLQKG